MKYASAFEDNNQIIAVWTNSFRSMMTTYCAARMSGSTPAVRISSP